MVVVVTAPISTALANRRWWRVKLALHGQCIFAVGIVLGFGIRHATTSASSCREDSRKFELVAVKVQRRAVRNADMQTAVLGAVHLRHGVAGKIHKLLSNSKPTICAANSKRSDMAMKVVLSAIFVHFGQHVAHHSVAIHSHIRNLIIETSLINVEYIKCL